MAIAWIIVVGVLCAAAGFAVAYMVTSKQNVDRSKEAEIKIEAMLAEAKAEEKDILLKAKDEALKIRTAAEQEAREARNEYQRAERRLSQKEENIDRKLEQIERREKSLSTKEQEAEEAKAEVELMRQEQIHELERVAAMNRDEAKAQLLQAVETEIRAEANKRVREIEFETKEEAEAKARKIIALAIQKYASDQVSESSVSVVPLPSEDMKGRIIGREGRNIRALEAATGVDLIIDDTPDTVILSGFDPVRREIARQALTKLIVDGRIHPARIEELVAKARIDVDNVMREEGEKAALEAKVHGMSPDLIKAMGRLHFRTSYSQNVLRHSIEIAALCSTMAHELGADVNIARRGGFLHDVGKGVSHEVEGPHAIIGGEIAKRLGESKAVVHAIKAHHGEEEPETVEALIVAAADAISAARPGARRENLETYAKRLEALENIANSFPGVDRSFAIQAGREVRIIVRPEEVDDLAAARLARDIVKQIQENLSYPGQIKVMVLRETRAVEFAK
ncbi:MAG TPA: ribonuclease Y [Chloroflexota bacterium]|nr:ribonuclease Y [Chloroflexota bacterium]